MSIANSGSVGRGKSFARGEVFAGTTKASGRCAPLTHVLEVAAPVKEARVIPILATTSWNVVTHVSGARAPSVKPVRLLEGCGK